MWWHCVRWCQMWPSRLRYVNQILLQWRWCVRVLIPQQHIQKIVQLCLTLSPKLTLLCPKPDDALMSLVIRDDMSIVEAQERKVFEEKSNFTASAIFLIPFFFFFFFFYSWKEWILWRLWISLRFSRRRNEWQVCRELQPPLLWATWLACRSSNRNTMRYLFLRYTTAIVRIVLFTNFGFVFCFFNLQEKNK